MCICVFEVYIITNLGQQSTTVVASSNYQGISNVQISVYISRTIV